MGGVIVEQQAVKGCISNFRILNFSGFTNNMHRIAVKQKANTYWTGPKAKI
jgi:hypothetical protein